MYTRTDSPAHIIQEVIDNSADEALGGHAKNLHVLLHLDGSITVTDDGRGIPVGLHPDEKIPVVVLAFTRLHAGGKFDKSTGNSAYAFSGGLHGVGVAVTNALSTRVSVEVRREGKIWAIEFSGGGEKVGALDLWAACGRHSGTRVRVWPDPKYFDAPRVPPASWNACCAPRPCCCPASRSALDIEQADGSVPAKTWSYPDGLAGYLAELAGNAEAVAPLYAAEKYADADHADFAPAKGHPGPSAGMSMPWPPSPTST
jgi:topoisomerase-4 subunit B